MNIQKVITDNLTQNVWYDSKLDRNAVFKAAILTTKIGAVGKVDYPMVSYRLPNMTDTFILLSLGVVIPSRIGLGGILSNWVRVEDIFESDTWLLIFTNGRKFNTKNSYIRVTEHNEILVAVDYFINSHITKRIESIYVRFYSNVYFAQPENRQVQGIKSLSHVVVGNDISSYLSFANQLSDVNKTLSFKNGLYLPDGLPDYSTLVIGDVLEFVQDPSISSRYILPVSNLPLYYSDVDNANKLIVSADFVNDNDFLADTEFFVVGTTSTNQRVGLYFPRINIPSIRPLTYKDFGVNAQMLQNALVQLANFADVGAITAGSVVLLRRTGGRVKQSVNGSSYINDLMNLPKSVRQQILTGINANLPMWRANTLETCDYNNFIQRLVFVNHPADYYGVYSRRELLEYLEAPISMGGNLWGIPVNGDQVGQFITFNAQGKNPTLIPVNRVSQGLGYSSAKIPVYLPFIDTNHPLEIVLESGDADTVTVPSVAGVMCLFDGNIQEIASELVDYTIQDNNISNASVISWEPEAITRRRIHRTAARGIAATFTGDLQSCLYGIDVYHGNIPSQDLGMRSLLVWLNGDYLIYGLDYILYLGKIYLASKRVTWTDTFTMFIVYTGLPNITLEYKDTTKFGFVKDNSILVNGKYDLLAYRNKLFFVDGAYYTVEEINEQEAYTDVLNTQGNTFVNGTPFAIVDRPQFVSDKLLDMYTKTEAAEEEEAATLSAYLSSVYPQTTTGVNVFIPEQYEIVSSLMNRLIYDIKSNLISGLTRNHYTGEQLRDILQPYLWYLHVDMTQKDLEFGYVIFSPSWDVGPSPVNIHEFAFLEAVNLVYLGNKVQRLGTYLTIV